MWLWIYVCSHLLWTWRVFFDYFIDIIAICFCFIFRTLDNLFITFWSPTELLMSCLPDFKNIYLWLSAFDCDVSAWRYLCNYLTWITCNYLYFWMYRLIFFIKFRIFLNHYFFKYFFLPFFLSLLLLALCIYRCC